MNIVRMKERIAIDDQWTAEERGFLLDALNFLDSRRAADAVLAPAAKSLRDKIERLHGLNAAERKVILDALLMNTPSRKHEYPEDFGPESSPVANTVWQILDQLPPDSLTISQRFMLAGMIGRALAAAIKTANYQN